LTDALLSGTFPFFTVCYRYLTAFGQGLMGAFQPQEGGSSQDKRYCVNRSENLQFRHMSNKLVNECAQDDKCGHHSRSGFYKGDQLKLIGDLLVDEPAIITDGLLLVTAVGCQFAGPFSHLDLYGPRSIFTARAAEPLGGTSYPFAGQADSKMPGGVRGTHGLRSDSYGGKQIEKIDLRLVSGRSVLQYPCGGFVITILLDDGFPPPFLLTQGVFFAVIAPDELAQDFVGPLMRTAEIDGRVLEYLPEPLFGLLKRRDPIEPLRHPGPVRRNFGKHTEPCRYADLVSAHPLLPPRRLFPDDILARLQLVNPGKAAIPGQFGRRRAQRTLGGSIQHDSEISGQFQRVLPVEIFTHPLECRIFTLMAAQYQTEEESGLIWFVGHGLH
jgi:hypothetical protein